jgi:hypothetical protein
MNLINILKNNKSYKTINVDSASSLDGNFKSHQSAEPIYTKN